MFTLRLAVIRKKRSRDNENRLYKLSYRYVAHATKVRQKSRECHSSPRRPSQTPRGRGNSQNQTSANQTNVRKGLKNP